MGQRVGRTGRRTDNSPCITGAAGPHLSLLCGGSDPMQFAYQPGIGVDDTIIFLLDRSLSPLEKPGSTVRMQLLGPVWLGLILYEGQCRGKASFVLTLVTEAVRCEAISTHTHTS